MSIDDKIKGKTKKNKAEIVGLLRSTKREGVEGLVDWMEQSDYFTAPASTRLDFHGCYKGGLAQHSLNVYKSFKVKTEMYGLNVSDEEMVIAALCHDFCKVDIYIPNMVQAKGKGVKKGKMVQSETKPYVIQEDFPYGHGEKSVRMAEKHIELTDKEALLMRWHMGPYDEGWERYGEKVKKACPEITAFHNADNEASKYLD